MSTLHTTLAQDSFRLYFGVIDYVIEHLRKDLRKKGHDEEEATEIVNKLQSKWKENLHKSHCIDNKNMMGLLDSNGNPQFNLPKHYPRNKLNMINSNPNAKNLNPIQPDSGLNYNQSNMMNDPQDIDHNHNHNHNSIEPKRKKQRLMNMNGPPPLLSNNNPNIIQPNYPQNNPHIQGLGVPQIDQIHNPFTHPQPVCLYMNCFILALFIKS